MAGAGQPWYMPVTWPVGHVSTAITKDAEDKPPKPSAGPYLDLVGNLTAMAAAARSWTLAYLAIYYLPGQQKKLKTHKNPSPHLSEKRPRVLLTL